MSLERHQLQRHQSLHERARSVRNQTARCARAVCGGRAGPWACRRAGESRQDANTTRVQPAQEDIVLLLHSDVFPYEPFSLQSILQHSPSDDTSDVPDSTPDAPDHPSEAPNSASSDAPNARGGDARPCGIAARRWVHCVPGTLSLPVGFSSRIWCARAVLCSKVDGFVPQTQHAKLRIVQDHRDTALWCRYSRAVSLWLTIRLFSSWHAEVAVKSPGSPSWCTRIDWNTALWN